ncbi:MULTISPECIES: Xaa-Pro peptidase family protein [Limibacillus]|jgi:Xaa-Pro aminopeptidase|uniref:Xaa-Pro aminopeptidase n=1 Tax=Limibacillus halophilus TaxID=1579333 RepID=A0A839SQW7_9PROT|nr:Xaa-Pro peptidase family protein [Limibacillus halophilus]MBB3064882.1 Xaa-Pro aminopeptidase [Limibacillus halophilus]
MPDAGNDKQSSAPRRGFPDQEFVNRTTRAQALMEAQGLDALLLTTEPEVRYFSGFLTQFWQSPTRPWFLILPKQGKPVAVIPAIGKECMARTWVEDIRTWSSPAPDDEGVSLLAATLLELVGPNGAVGLPEGPETHLRMPLGDYRILLEWLPGIAIQDASAILRSLRQVKSEAEIEKIAYICDLVSGVFEDLPGLLHQGMSEIEIFRRFKIECLKRGADDVAYLVGGAGPGGYGDIISPPSNRPVAAGDILILDTGSIFDGYFCDFDRNYAFGHASDAVKRAYAAVYEATEAGLAAAKPGASCSEVFAAMQDVMDRAGAMGNDVGRLGHGLGMQLTEWPSNRPGDETRLEPGMILTLEPGMTFEPGHVMVHEENIVIRPDGAHLLTRRAAAEIPIIR